MTHRSNVKLGVEVFLEKFLDLVKSKRVGLITNPTGIDSNVISTITLFTNTPDIHLVALYGPEHGVRGDAKAGEYVPYRRDEKLDIPVFSLYGQAQKSDPDMLANIDESMRSFDTADEGKGIEPSMVENIDVRHGMTVGELALLFNANFLSQKTNLTVIPMKGWERSMWFDETALPWIFPSPNMPSLETATVYPGQVFLEGTNVSEGRGTSKPFEVFGAPWIDGAQLAKVLNGLKLPGVRFQETWFNPEISKYQGQVCEGAQIHVMDRTRFKPFKTSMFIIQAIMDMNLEQFLFHDEYFDKIMGTRTVREELEEHHDVTKIMNKFCDALDVFRNLRKPHLLY